MRELKELNKRKLELSWLESFYIFPTSKNILKSQSGTCKLFNKIVFINLSLKLILIACLVNDRRVECEESELFYWPVRKILFL